MIAKEESSTEIFIVKEKTKLCLFNTMMQSIVTCSDAERAKLHNNFDFDSPEAENIEVVYETDGDEIMSFQVISDEHLLIA